MNPGPLFIIRNTFILLLSCFLFAALFESENPKIFTFLNLHPKHQIQSTPLQFLLSYFILSSFTCFIFTCVYLLTRNLVLDNHAVELGTQGFILFCRIARRREGEIALYSIPREFDINPQVTLVGKILC